MNEEQHPGSSPELGPDRWKLARRLLEEALDLPQADREAWLDKSCSEDEELRTFVENLLAIDGAEADRDADTWIDEGAPGDMVARALSQQDFAQGWIDDYRIQGALGSGGTATVLRAEQQHPKRIVAVKIMRFGILSENAQRRFEYESEILGSLRHPGIAQVYSSGTYKDALSGQQLPYFAMEYIEDARPLDLHVRDAKTTLNETLSLFLQICDAVHHGHQRGILHRDLKPNNILVDKEGHPKIIDFGIARAIGSDSEHRERTLQGEIVGTLHYMSPEQLDFDSQDPDLRCDVYALGVILYELLTGVRPFDLEERSMTEIIQTIDRGLLVRPSARGMVLTGSRVASELDWIVQKAMERERERRYSSVSDLSADVRRFLADEPLEARPPRKTYLIRKFVKRHRLAVVAATTLFLALLTGITITSLALRRARLEAETTQSLNSFLLDMIASVDPYEDGREVKVLALIDRAAAKAQALDGVRPAFAATLHATLGATLLRLGQNDEALLQLEDAWRLASTSLGADHPVALSSLHDLAATLYQLGKIERANDLAEKAYEGRRRALGLRHVDTAKTLALTALLANSRQDLEQAETRYVRARDIFVDLQGSESQDAIQADVALGTIALARGSRSEAIDLLRSAIERGKVSLGPEHPTMLTAKKTMASISLAEGRIDEAVALLSEVEASEMKVLGPHHGSTLQTLNNLAGALQKADRTEDALQRYRDLLDRRQKAGVYKHYMTGIALGNLAVCLEKLDRLEEADEGFTSCFAMFRASRFPENHWVLAAYRKGLAVLRSKQGRFEEAEKLLVDCLTTFEKASGDHSSRIRATQMALLEVYEKTQQSELAHKLREKLGKQ